MPATAVIVMIKIFIMMIRSMAKKNEVIFFIAVIRAIVTSKKGQHP